MVLEEIIHLFDEMEQGKEGQMLGYHLHKPIAQAMAQQWHTNQNFKSTFSGFLTALATHPKP